jgi:hypothetical protein
MEFFIILAAVAFIISAYINFNKAEKAQVSKSKKATYNYNTSPKIEKQYRKNSSVNHKTFDTNDCDNKKYAPKTTVWEFMSKAKLKENETFAMTVCNMTKSTMVFVVNHKKYSIHAPQSLKEYSGSPFGAFLAHIEFVADHPKTGTPIYKVIIDDRIDAKSIHTYKKDYDDSSHLSMKEMLDEDLYECGWIPDTQSRGWD